VTDDAALKLREAALLADVWKASADPHERQLGADLAQVLDMGDDVLPRGFNRPVVVDKKTLQDTLAMILGVIEMDDSAGGFIQYEWADEPGKFEVVARYRVGNAMGQGGIRILHEDGPSA
jgi:hypothetical protein